MRKFMMWADAEAYLIANNGNMVLDCIGRGYGYRDALSAMGYDKAERRGLLPDYKRLVLDVVQAKD